MLRGHTVLLCLLGLAWVARANSPVQNPLLHAPALRPLCAQLEVEVEAAVRKELTSWRKEGDDSPDLGDGSPEAIPGASTTAQQLARALGEDARVENLHRIGQQ